jgi:hypothetical protein
MDMSSLITANLGSNTAATDEQAGAQAGANLSSTTLANNQTAYANNVTRKLADAINQSIDPKSGSVDFDKLSTIGKQMGIGQATLNYAIETIPKIHTAAAQTAIAKRTTASLSPKGAQQINQDLSGNPSAAPGQSYIQQSGRSVAVPNEAPTAAPTAAPTGNAMSDMNTMEVGSPTSTATKESDESGLSTPPSNDPKVLKNDPNYYVNHPDQDVEGNTQKYLRSQGYLTGNTDYPTAYKTAMTDVYNGAYKSEGVPPMPDPHDDPTGAKWLGMQEAAAGKAQAAVVKWKQSLQDNNYKQAEQYNKNNENVVTLDGTNYRAYDANSKHQVEGVIPIQGEAQKVQSDLKAIDKSDLAGLRIEAARAARIYAMSMHPGADISMGSLQEVGTQIFGDGQDELGHTMGMISAYISAPDGKGFDAVGKYIDGVLKNYDGATVKNRLTNMMSSAIGANDRTLKGNLIGYESASDKAKKSPANPSASPSASTQETGTIDSPITYSKGMVRDPNKVYKLSSGIYYGDGRPAQ